jgi:hypothetical protein
VSAKLEKPLSHESDVADYTYAFANGVLIEDTDILSTDGAAVVIMDGIDFFTMWVNVTR